MNTSSRASRVGLACRRPAGRGRADRLRGGELGGGRRRGQLADRVVERAGGIGRGEFRSRVGRQRRGFHRGGRATTAATTPTGTAPAGGPVPIGFAATSVTFVSPQEAFVLGTAPCAKAPCTSILRTLDRGASWRGLPAPVVPLAAPAGATGPAVWGIRFANPSDGFVFGNGLWETTDGGEQWSPAASPGGSIESLEVIDGQVLAVVDRLPANGGCAEPGTLERRPLAGGAWQAVARVAGPARSPPRRGWRRCLTATT